MIRERILGLLYDQLGAEPPNLEQGGQANDTLVEILVNDVDADFHNGRAEAITKLETLDIAAFWLQAVGDGSPLEVATHDTLETRTPHRMAWEAGFDDTLGHQKISQIAHQLFAHHIGMMVTPAHESVSDRAALDNFLAPSTEYANELYADATDDTEKDAWDEMQYPRPTALDDAVDDARSLLESESLTYFWIQVLCDVGSSSFVMQIGGPSAEEQNMFVDHPIEYIVGIPHALAPNDEVNINLQSLAQHLSYGARVTDESVEEFASAALDMTLDLGYLHDGPSPL